MTVSTPAISTPAIWVARPEVVKKAVDVKLVTAIDVGTTKVCTILGQVSATNNLEIVAYSTVPSDGLRKGNVYDVSTTTDAVKKSVQQVEASTGLEIKSAYVGITGSHVSFENRRSQVSAGNSGVITTAELNRQSPESAKSEPGRELIHALKMTYTIDGERGIRNPRGMHSNDVAVDTHIVTAGSAYVNKLTAAIENVGIKIDGLVLEPLASGIAILQPNEKRQGVIVVDIGGGTTDVVGFKDGRICYTGVVPVGGYQFTNDIAVTFNSNFAAAEEAKLAYGNTDIPTGTGAVRLKLPVVDKEVDVELRPPDICRLTRERALELIQMIGTKIAESGLANRNGFVIALTGGASNLPGLADLMQRKLNMRVRHGRPEGKCFLPDELSHPAYATGVGILLWASAQPEISPQIARNYKTMSSIRNRVRSGFFWSILRMFFNPMAVVSGRKVRS